MTAKPKHVRVAATAALITLLAGCGSGERRGRSEHDPSAIANPDEEAAAPTAPGDEHDPHDGSDEAPIRDAQTGDSTVRPGPSEAGAPHVQTQDAAAPVVPVGMSPAAPNDDAGAHGDSCKEPDGPRHPLTGRYAVRTVAHARHKATYAGSPIDTVSKAVLVSIADVSAEGTVTEELCTMEVLVREGLYGWIGPASLSAIAKSRSALVARENTFVRLGEEDETFLGFRPYATLDGCTGRDAEDRACLCDRTDVPTSATDCRVSDADGDGLAGLTMSADLQRRVVPAATADAFTALLVGVKAVEWTLPMIASDRLRGTTRGGVALWPLALGGTLGADMTSLRSATCGPELAHVELVRSDLHCDALVDARANGLDSLGIFDVSRDATLPNPAACDDPDCAIDTDRDAVPDCDDDCASDPEKRSAGQCGCGQSEADRDADGTADCIDACPADASRITPGECGCDDEYCRELEGTYAARSTVHLTLPMGSDVRSWRVTSYALVTIDRGELGRPMLREQPCWSVSVPNLNSGAPVVYSWTSPSDARPSAPVVRSLARESSGQWLAISNSVSVGFDPLGCSSGPSLPVDWPSSWGSSCTCAEDQSSLPPYDPDATVYDCRLRDEDHDGAPGISVTVATVEPSAPTFVPPPAESARIMLAASNSDRWTVRPSRDGWHTGSIESSYQANIVGCTGAGCPALPARLPAFEACGSAETALQLAPVEPMLVASCSELLSRTEELFAGRPEPAWLGPAVCR